MSFAAMARARRWRRLSYTAPSLLGRTALWRKAWRAVPPRRAGSIGQPWPAFNLGGYPERSRGGEVAHEITDVPVPAYGAVVLVRWD